MFNFKINLGSMILGAALAAGLVATSFAPQAAYAQATSGNISGVVTDTTGAVLPAAKVQALNVATGVSVEVVSNSKGEFLISNLLPGNYNITGIANGFTPYSLKNFEVRLNETANAKLVLPVGSQTTSVEVSAEASVSIDTTTTQLQTTFQSKELSDLPTASVGLGVLNPSLLSSGVASSGAIGAGTGPSVGGQRPRANNYTVEGVDNNNKAVTGPLVYIPNDATGEFTLITNQFSPEFGHSAGGQFNVTIKSGTNKFHGTAYEYFQNRNLNANNAIQGGKVPIPRYDNNRYGGEVGGPIWKDKVFFLGAYERNNIGQSTSYPICTPTAAGVTMLGTIPNLSANNLGIYTKYTPVSPSQVTSENDLACGNAVSGDLQYLTVWSGTDPNNDKNSPSFGEFASGTQYQIPLGNYQVSAPVFSNFDVLTTGFDYTISPKDSLRGRYIYNNLASLDTAAVLPVFYQSAPQKFHLIALSEYHNFSTNLINEARIGFNRFQQLIPSGNFVFPGVDSFPNLTIFDQNGLNYGPDGNAPQFTIQNLYQFTDNISWIKGKHTFKFGFDGRKFISPQSFTQRARGDYQWDILSEYLHDLAPNAFGERSSGSHIYYGDQTALYGYVNDTWKATEKLSLNFGVRYEFTSVPVGERSQVLNIAASAPGLVTFATPKPQYNNYTPRLGIVFAPNENTSIRAGFGMAIDVLYDNLGTLSFPPQFSSTQDVGSGLPGIKNQGDPNFLADGGLPAPKGSLKPLQFATIADQRAATSAFVPDQKLPYAETWSLGVEHVFLKNYTAEIRYLGTRGIHLPAQVRLNKQAKTDSAHFLPTLYSAPSDAELASLQTTLASILARSSTVAAFRNPADGKGGFTSNLTSFVPASESNYNGLAASLIRRFQNGLQMNLAYTWSKTMDDATADVFSTVLTPRRPQDFQNVSHDYSRSALDRTHRLTLEVVYDIPFFKNSNFLARNLLGNWEIAPIYTYESPEYFTAISGDGALGTGDSTYTNRTIVNPNGKKGTGSGVTAQYDLGRSAACGLDADGNPIITCNANLVAYLAKDPTAQYIRAQVGALPNAARNTLPINPINNFDATAVKRFSFKERYKFEFQAQAFNVLNHSQYIPGAIDNINSPGDAGGNIAFQEPQSSLFNQPAKQFLSNARTMQLAVKIAF